MPIDMPFTSWHKQSMEERHLCKSCACYLILVLKCDRKVWENLLCFKPMSTCSRSKTPDFKSLGEHTTIQTEGGHLRVKSCVVYCSCEREKNHHLPPLPWNPQHSLAPSRTPAACAPVFMELASDGSVCPRPCGRNDVSWQSDWLRTGG